MEHPRGMIMMKAMAMEVMLLIMLVI